VPRIINDKPDNSVVKRKVCANCGVKVEYVPAEVKERHGTDYSGGPDGCKWIDCPKCGKMIVLKSW
jgi:ribosomal protein S27AE